MAEKYLTEEEMGFGGQNKAPEYLTEEQMGFPRKPSGILRRVGDQGIKLAQGVIGVPETAVGLADLVTGGHAGKAAEDAGIRFKDAKGVLGEYLSPEQQAADTAVQDAKGFFPTIGAMVKNPSTIIGGAMESAPSMLAGGVAARGIMAGLPYFAPKVAAQIAAAEAAPLVASQGARTLAQVAPIAAGAAGEGLVTAGANAEQVRQQTADGLLTPEQIGLSAGSGALTGLIGFGAGKVANKLGIGDVQTMLARGKLGAVGAEAEQAAAQKGLLRKIGEGFANEGILQELPQSYQEQVAQNLALGKPWDQGAAEAGAQGMMAGGLMGMGGNAASHFAGPGPDKTGQQSQTPPNAPPTTPPNAPPSVPQTNSPGSPAGTAGTAGTPQANMGPISQAAAAAAGAATPGAPGATVGTVGTPPAQDQQSKDESYAKNRSIMDGILSGWNKTQREHPASTATPQAQDQQPAAPDGAPSPVTPTATAVTPAATAVTPASGKLSDAATIAVENGAHEVETAKLAQQQAEEAKKKGASTASGLPQFTAKAQPTTLGQSPTTVSAGPGFGIKDVSKQAQAPTAQEQPPAQPAQNSEQFIKQLKEQINGLEVGDSLVNDMGDSFAVETVIRNKQGDVTGIVTPPVEGGKRGTLDVDQIASILTSQPYTDVNTGERKMSAPGSIQKAKPATATTQNAPNAAQTVAQGAVAAQPTQAAAQNGKETAQHISDKATIDAAAHQAATSPKNDLPEPTQAQKEAGNYTKGHIRLHGMDIAIENPRGSTRSGKNQDGTTWEHTMSDHYGYVKRTIGSDGDQVDVYVGPKPESARVYVVDQLDQKTGAFDEHKAMLGFDSQDAAVAAYKSNFDKGWKVGPIRDMSVDEFKDWVDNGDTTKPATMMAQRQPPTQPGLPGQGAATQAAAASKAENQSALDRIASGKAWFGNEIKAKNWVHTNGLTETHEVKMTAPRRFEVVPKKQPQEQINANQDQQTKSQDTQGIGQASQQNSPVMADSRDASSQPNTITTNFGKDTGTTRAIGESNLPTSRHSDVTATEDSSAPENNQLPFEMEDGSQKPLSVPEKLQAKREANDIREQSLENAQNNADTEIKKEAENDPAKQGSTPTLNHPLDEGQQPAGSQSPARGARQARAGEGRRDDGGVRRGRQPDNLGGESGQEGINDGSVHTGSKHGETGGMAGDSGRHASDFIPSNGGLTREGSWFDTAKRNIDLIELAIKIESENRAATPEEQAQLSKYVGFGAGAIRNELFPVPPEYAKRQEPNRLIWPNYVRNARFKPLAERIEALPREWQQSILQSSQYAHYTSEGIIRSVWSGLQRMGFTGGNVFEPGMGIGSFAMLMPNTVRKTSRYTGVEFDAPTALIARLLSPQQNMLHGDFIKRKFPKNFFDVNVGNPPFSQTKIFGDPEYAKHGFMLHDFFFAKGIDLVRPGGIQVFVTSKGTMDKQNDKARKYLAERADLLGAVRLPSTAFEDNAGTSVVTDVIFLRKRAPGEEPAGHAWGSVATVETKDGPVVVNEYFAAHPEMVLGQQRISGNMDDMGRRINSNGMGGEKYTVVSYDSTPAELDAKFAKAIENLPENAYSVMSQSPDAIKDETAKIDFDPSIKREGVVYLGPDGTLMRVENGVGKPLADTLKLSAKDAAWFKSYVGLRDLVQEARFAQVNDGNWETSLKKLNKAYDAFRKQHGPIKDYRTITRKSTDEDGNVVEAQTRIFKNQSLWREDYDSSLITALETISEEGNIVKAPFLLGRTIGKPVTREVKTIGDALAVSLDSTGELNLDDVANRMHISRDEAIDALGNQIYQAPNGEWQLADEYLSGNVVQKLDEAEEAARLKPELRRNVEALKQAQPEKLGPSKISAKLGSSWIPVEHVNEFSTEIDAGNVTFDPKTETWQVEGGNLRSQRKASAEYGTADRSPSELLEAVLNSRPIKITAKTADGKTVTNNEATTAANEAAKKIKDKFKGWVWTDTNRASELVEIYNRRYNNIAPRKFDGSHLTLPGVSLRYKLHPHQLRAIWRIIQTGNTYLAHAVGAGKTIEMIAAGMEQKRLGLVKKPMYVVPNHMLEQFSNEFMDLYPLANIMVADDQNFSADKRKAFIASATLNNPDAIIITHDAFQRIGVKEESIAPIRDEILTDLELELSSMAKDKGARVRRSQLEQQIEAVKQRFDRILGAGGKDATIKFEDMGVDFVFVDEAHAMRKLDFQTSQQIKGIDPNGSKRALDMYIKTRILDKKNPGRSMVFASGTPVTNTMGELYTIMRFFAAHQMDVDGISTFDAWSRQFGEVAPALEPNAAGKYEMVERFAKFDNVPELMSRVRQFMDVLTSDNLGALIKRPDLVGGKPNMNIISMSQSLKSYMQNVLAPRIEVSKKWKPTRDEPFNTDPILKIISDGRFAAIDPRFFGGALQEGETSIINEMGDKITANYHATKDNVYLDKDGKPEPVKGSTQIVFYNNGYGASAKENRGFDARAALTKRLTAGGIPRNEIAWFDDADTDAKKEAIFKDMRSGKLKVLIGSAKKMGTGVNVQKRLAVLHYQDPPWYPADVEQPHGRIIRQGNQNPEVKIEWYTTKGTYQSTMWQMVGRKQRFIDQAFTGDKNLRSMEDMGEASLFEQAAAVASGDPRAIQLAGLRQDVERFERLQAAHASEQINIRSSLRSHEWSVQALNNRINTLSKAFNAIGGRFFSFADTHGKVNGVVYSKPGEFGQAIKDAFNKVAADSVMDGGKRIIDKQIARLGDAVTVTMDSSLDRHDKADGSFYLMVNVGETSLQVAHSVAMGADVDAAGLARRVFNQINSIDSDLRKARMELTDAETEITKLRKKLGAPFEYQQEMVEKYGELKRLEAELRAEGEAIQNQPTNVAINADGDIVADGPVQQSRSRTTKNPTTVHALQSAIRQTLGVFLGNGLGRVVATTSSEVKSTWEPLVGNTGVDSKDAAGQAQAFYDHKTKTIFLMADRIEAGTEQAVLVHELMHKHGKAVLGQEGWDKLHAAIESWKDAKPGSQERQVYDAAAERVAAIGAELSSEELFPYAVEVAIKLGIKPNMLTKPGTITRWLAEVRNALRKVWDKLVRRPDTFNAQDMVNMAFGIAQRENAPGFGLDTSISWDSERLDRLMSQYAYPSNDKKTKAFAAWVSPQDFLAATTPQGYAAVLEGEAKDLDAQELKRQVQEIYLEGKIGHGKFVVTGHEGRHRMVALARAGVKRVPVVFYTEGSATENATKIDELRATPQKWAETSAERGFRVENLTPISWAYFDELSSEFASNADIRYSRATFAATANKAASTLSSFVSHPGTLSGWWKTVGSMYGLAQKHDEFKPVFEAGQRFLNDVSFYATEAANLAPTLLPKLERIRDIAKAAIPFKDNKPLADALFQGTLSWKRDAAGKLEQTDKVDEAGVIFSDDELKSTFGMNDRQVGLYREARAAIDNSLDNTAKAAMVQLGGKEMAYMRDMVMGAPSAGEAAHLLTQELVLMGSADPTQSARFAATATDIQEVADRINQLKANGYAPLSRFGRYTVSVRNGTKQEYFGLFESKREANTMADKMRGLHPGMDVKQGTLSQKEFEQYQGITPETAELFGEMLGLDQAGPLAKEAFQEYLRMVKNNRSALKRLIHRKGIAGYNEDVGRVLSAFIASNARKGASDLHLGDMSLAVSSIPQDMGELKDIAIGLQKYLVQPQEEAPAMRGMLFAQYIGGSVASAMVNLTQPMQVSMPYLSQFGGAKKATAALVGAYRDMATKGFKYAPQLEAALKIAEEEGIVAPQEIHQLQAQARGAATLRSGDGTPVGELLAMSRNGFTRLMLGWGKMFGLAEQVNRRATFIAAFRMAQAQGITDPAKFASKAVNETQFVNNKGNRMMFGRGAIGSVAMTFKSYGLNYLELLHRLATQDGTDGKYAAALMIGMLMLMAGAGGLPFEDDLHDLIDAIAQRMGYNISSNRAKQKFLEETFGKAAADFIDKGITGLPGVPIDMSLRMGMGNMIPGTGLLLQKRDHTRDVLELAGPAGDFGKRLMEGFSKLADGKVGGAILDVAPRAVSSAAQGVGMLNKGYYSDTHGRKVIDTTTGEGLAKIVGFQPQSVAADSEKTGFIQRMKDTRAINSGNFAEMWAKGIYEGDPQQVQDAQAAIRDWNEKNPDTRITPNIAAILRRVREMRKTRDQRIIDSSPKAMRPEIRRELMGS